MTEIEVKMVEYIVSTRSRPKAADVIVIMYQVGFIGFQHAAARRRLRNQFG